MGLGIGFATYKVGLSFAFGAFVAGIVLSESEHNHQALSDIVPLRDVFGLLFFASVGMLLEPGFVRQNWGLVLALVAVVGLAKGLVFPLLGRAFGYGNVVPLALGLTMFQGGEFAFVLGRVGVDTGSIDGEMYSLIMSVALITMFLTPFVSRATAPVYSMIKRRRSSEPMQTINIARDELQLDHKRRIIVQLDGQGIEWRAEAGHALEHRGAGHAAAARLVHDGLVEGAPVGILVPLADVDAHAS